MNTRQYLILIKGEIKTSEIMNETIIVRGRLISLRKKLCRSMFWIQKRQAL